MIKTRLIKFGKDKTRNGSVVHYTQNMGTRECYSIDIDIHNFLFFINYFLIFMI
ncbi:hypothetical protein QIA30_05495 (plasmid) [Borreliella turdi]